MPQLRENCECVVPISLRDEPRVVLPRLGWAITLPSDLPVRNQIAW